MPKRFALALVLCAPFFPATAATIQLGSPVYTAMSNSDDLHVGLEVRISQLLAGAQLGAFDLIFHFDSAALVFRGFDFGTFLGRYPDSTWDIHRVNVFDQNVTEYRVASVSLLTASELQLLQPSSFSLGTIMFASRGPHFETPVSVSGLLSDGSGNPLDVTFQGALVQQIPEPGPRWLLAIGLLAIAGARRVRMQGSQKRLS